MKIIQNNEQNQIETSREKTIIRTSVIGIIANVFLAGFKAVVGLMSNSIAIVLDAVNNISDAGSSLITIIGTKLAGKQPDKEHPFGYGRIEYLSAMIISVIVLYVGITSLIESGEDATLDSIISASTLIAAAIYLFSGISLEAYLGAVISLVIIKSGIEMLKDTISSILGEKNDPELAREIKRTVTGFKDVRGAYDLVLNNYGPDAHNGSIHIEVPDTYSADQLDQLIREIQMEVYAKHNVILTAIGVYSVNTRDKEVIETQKKVRDIVFKNPYVRQMHGFYLLKNEKAMRFDIVVSFDAKDRYAVYEEVISNVQKEFPDYKLVVTMDTDFAEE